MPITQAVNSKANIKKFTNNDIPYQPAQPVLNRYEGVSYAAQTVIDLPFSVQQSSAQSFLLFVNGILLTPGSSNDYEFTAISSTGYSSTVQLNQSLPANLNIEGIMLGLVPADELVTDNRFVQLYQAEAQSFQGFVNTSSFKLTPTSATPGAGQFWSTIANRAPIVDLSNDLKVRMGVERLQVQQLIRVVGEAGPFNNAAVYTAQNDTYGQIRAVGTWIPVGNDINGIRPYTDTVGDFCEVTFYGTGLNLLTISGEAGNRDIRPTVDNGVEGSNICLANESIATGGQNRCPNEIVLAVQGLTLGIHTVRLRLYAGEIDICGFEILNETASLVIPPGIAYNQDQVITSSTLNMLSYNSGFTNVYGTPGANGGKVLVYLKPDGTIGKDIQYTDTMQSGTSTSHVNEELTRTYGFREFGFGFVAEDFSGELGITAAATLNDDVTNLACAAPIPVGGTQDSFYLTNGNYVYFTFVGTGLDFLRIDTGTTGDVLDSHTIAVDGVTIYNITGQTSYASPQVMPIISGLPYGTHVFSMSRNTTGSQAIGTYGFNVYGPKKPALPAGCVALADYNLLATFVANTTPGITASSTGVIRKGASTGFTYVEGTGGSNWTLANNEPFGYVNSYEAVTTNGNAVVRYTFYGTGFDYRFTITNGASTDIRLVLNGSPLIASNFPSAVFTPYSGVTYDSVTLGSLTQQNASTVFACGLSVSNLPLGVYTIEMTSNVALQWSFNTFDVITPIYSPADAGPIVINNLLPLGNTSVGDRRNTTTLKDISAQIKPVAYGISNSNTYTTTSTTPVTNPDMILVVKSKGQNYEIGYSVVDTGSASPSAMYEAIFVDGVQQGNHGVGVAASSGYNVTMSGNTTIYLTPGYHVIQLFRSAGGAYTLSSTANCKNFYAKPV